MAKRIKSKVNEAANYTKPGMRKRLFNRIKAGSKGGNPGQWSARKAQLLALLYRKTEVVTQTNGTKEITAVPKEVD